MALELACGHLLSLQSRGRLVAGRAADERDDGRRGHAPARVPRRAPSRADASARRRGSAPSSAPTARGRTSTAGPATCRRRSRPTGRCAWPATPPDAEHMRAAAEFIREQGGIERARVFTHLWLALFGLWSWDDVPALPPEIDPAAAVVPAEHLRLRLLGAADDRRAVARESTPAGASAAVRPRRAATAARPAGRARRAVAARWAGCRSAGPRAARLRAPAAAAAAAARAGRAPSAGSCAARRPTARGAASSRRGCTR